MVQYIINISKEANKILNLIKAIYDLPNKSKAIEKLTEIFEKEILEKELKPEFIRRMKKIKKEKTVKINNVDTFLENL